jgi:phosphoribosylanthranilate isomerase
MWLKICGINSVEALQAALAARVDAIGFVFSPSVRRVEPEQAAALAAAARSRVSLVAVTRHPTQALIDEIVRVFKPDVLQTDWSDFAALQLPDSLARLPVLRGAAGGTADGVAGAAGNAASGTAGGAGAGPAAGGAELPPRLMFEGARSGSGEVADWVAAERLARRRELVLAGGLNAHNVGSAIRAVRPYGVDVSSGVESAPGCKSAQKIAEFVDAARAGLHAQRFQG